MIRTFFTVFLVLIFIAVVFTLGQISTTYGSERKEISQDDLIIAIKVWANGAQGAHDQSDVVVYKNAFNLVKRGVTNVQKVQEYESYFQQITAYRASQDGRTKIYCSTLAGDPYIGSPINPRHNERPDLFYQVLQEKLEKDMIGLDEITGFLTRLKTKELSLSTGIPKQRYVVFEPDSAVMIGNNKIILQPKIDNIELNSDKYKIDPNKFKLNPNIIKPEVNIIKPGIQKQ